MTDKTKTWDYDFEELCTCGHPGDNHCLDDDHCHWDPRHNEHGGACFDPHCGCAVYRPQSINPEETERA